MSRRKSVVDAASVAAAPAAGKQMQVFEVLMTCDIAAWARVRVSAQTEREAVAKALVLPNRDIDWQISREDLLGKPREFVTVEQIPTVPHPSAHDQGCSQRWPAFNYCTCSKSVAELEPAANTAAVDAAADNDEVGK